MTYSYFDALRSTARRQGHENPTHMAIYGYIMANWPSLPIEERPHLAKATHKLYDVMRGVGKSQEEAWFQCETFVKEQVTSDLRGKAHSQNDAYQKPFSRANSSWAFDSFADVLDALPQARSGFKSRTPGSRSTQQNSMRGESYQPDDRHQGESSSRFSLGGESNGGSYRTEERRPSGVGSGLDGGQSYSYSYSYTKYTTTDSSAPPQNPPRSSYNTKEFRPEGYSRPYSKRDARPGPPRDSYSRTYPTHDARPSGSSNRPPPHSSSSRSAPRRPPPPPPAGTMDPYLVLGVSRSASSDEIKKAFHKLSLKWHPDKVPAADREKATEKFKVINQAKEMLLDKNMRAAYDRKTARA